jgi:hypothetical protein
MTDLVALKPCPFCGGEAVEQEQQGGYIVACGSANKCAFSPSHLTKDKRKHRRNITAWNTRSLEQSTLENKELREVLIDIRNRILCPVGPTPSLDQIAEIASRAALNRSQNT